MAKKKRKRKTSARSPGKAAGSGWLSSYDWTRFGLDLLLLVPPFVFLPGIADSFRLPKLVLSLTLALVALALWCLRLRPGSPSPVVARRPRSQALVLWAVAPLVLVASLGLWTSHHPAVTWRALPAFWVGAAFLVGAATLLGPTDRRRAVELLTWPACGLAALGLLQASGLWQPMNFEDGVTERLAVTSLAGGAFDLSAYLLLPLFWCQHRLWAGRSRATTEGGVRRWTRWLWPAALVLLSAALLATQTLGVLVAAVAGSAVLWLLELRAAGVSARRLGLAVGAVLAVALAASLAVTPVRERVVNKTRQIAQGDVNRFLTGRLDGWRAAVWMSRQAPLTGVGAGGYAFEFGRARLALQDAGVEFWPGHKQPYFANAHNDWLEAAAEYGVPGGLAVAWLLAWLARSALRRSESGDEGRTDSDRLPAPFLWGSVVAMALVSLSNFPWHLALIAFPWLLVVAEIFDPRAASTGTTDEAGRVVWPKPAVGILCVVVLLAAVGVFRHGKNRIGAQRLVRTAEAVAMEGGRRGQMPPRALDLGLDLLRRAEELDPVLVSTKITRGGLFMVAGRASSAERAYAEALELQNRSEIWMNLARLRLREGDTEGALDAARSAIALGARVRRDLPEFDNLLSEE